jgi:hypothetical protein
MAAYTLVFAALLFPPGGRGHRACLDAPPPGYAP